MVQHWCWCCFFICCCCHLYLLHGKIKIKKSSFGEHPFISHLIRWNGLYYQNISNSVSSKKWQNKQKWQSVSSDTERNGIIPIDKPSEMFTNHSFGISLSCFRHTMKKLFLENDIPKGKLVTFHVAKQNLLYARQFEISHEHIEPAYFPVFHDSTINDNQPILIRNSALPRVGAGRKENMWNVNGVFVLEQSLDKSLIKKCALYNTEALNLIMATATLVISKLIHKALDSLSVSNYLFEIDCSPHIWHSNTLYAFEMVTAIQCHWMVSGLVGWFGVFVFQLSICMKDMRLQWNIEWTVKTIDSINLILAQYCVRAHEFMWQATTKIKYSFRVHRL